jgi:hypothetical protein
VYFLTYANPLSANGPRTHGPNDSPALVAEKARSPKGDRVDEIGFPLTPTANLEAAGRNVLAIDAIVVW